MFSAHRAASPAAVFRRQFVQLLLEFAFEREIGGRGLSPAGFSCFSLRRERPSDRGQIESRALLPSVERLLRPITRLTRRSWSTKSAAASASLRSVLRGVPICARMVRPRAKSVTWIARSATGKSGGMSPALIPSRKRRSTSATPPATALCRSRWTSASFTIGATHIIRQPRADPFSVALSTAYLRKSAIESRRLCGERSAFAANAPFRSAYASKDAQEYRPLVPEDGIQARPSHTHPGDEIVNRHSVVAFRPEHLSRLFQRPRLIEAARSAPRPSGFLNHSVHNSLTLSIRQYITN